MLFAELDGRLRLMDGGSGVGYEYGRLEIFLRGFWSAVCNRFGFTPAAAQVACRALGYGGGAAIRFLQPDTGVKNGVRSVPLEQASEKDRSLLACLT